MIFKKEFYDESICSIALHVATASINAARSIIGLWDIVQSNFYSISISDFIDEVSNNLVYSKIFGGFKFSEYYTNEISSERFINLTFAFFKYYEERLPMLRGIKLKNLNKRLGKREIEHIMIQSYNYLLEQFPSMEGKQHPFKNTYRNNSIITISLLLGNVLRKQIDDITYSSESLFCDIEDIYPEKRIDTNINKLAFTVITDSFPMFYDALSKVIVEYLFISANFGHIIGTKTTEELCKTR